MNNDIDYSLLHCHSSITWVVPPDHCSVIWVMPPGRSLYKQALQRCVICRKYCTNSIVNDSTTCFYCNICKAKGKIMNACW